MINGCWNSKRESCDGQQVNDLNISDPSFHGHARCFSHGVHTILRDWRCVPLLELGLIEWDFPRSRLSACLSEMFLQLPVRYSYMLHNSLSVRLVEKIPQWTALARWRGSLDAVTPGTNIEWRSILPGRPFRSFKCYLDWFLTNAVFT